MMSSNDAPAGVGRRVASGTSLKHNLIVHDPINYRTPPAYLTTGSIIAELVAHIGDAEDWPGELGDYARQRAAALRTELARRER